MQKMTKASAKARETSNLTQLVLCSFDCALIVGLLKIWNCFSRLSFGFRDSWPGRLARWLAGWRWRIHGSTCSLEREYLNVIFELVKQVRNDLPLSVHKFFALINCCNSLWHVIRPIPHQNSPTQSDGLRLIGRDSSCGAFPENDQAQLTRKAMQKRQTDSDSFIHSFNDSSWLP